MNLRDLPASWRPVAHRRPPTTPKPRSSYVAALASDSPSLLQSPICRLRSLRTAFSYVRISEESFQRGLERCKTNLIGRASSPIKTHELVQQLKSCWSGIQPWTAAPLGRNFFMLQFANMEDMKRVWACGSVRLVYGFLSLIQWSPEFSPKTYQNTFSHAWVRFWDLGFAYWDQQTLFEIAAGVGIPLKIDSRTKERTVGLFARVLIDVELSRPLPDRIRITRNNGEVVVIRLEFESLPEVCSKCGLVGHDASFCRVRRDQPQDEGMVRGRSVVRSSRKRPKSRSRRGQIPEGPMFLPEVESHSAPLELWSSVMVFIHR